jgi:acid stress-induced BolA-like protein IbaG/YrbA
MSVDPQELKQRIESAIPGASAEVSGDGHHFNAVVRAAAFDGLSRIAQHKLVYDVFGDELGARIHALQLKTHAPAAAIPPAGTSTPSPAPTPSPTPTPEESS